MTNSYNATNQVLTEDGPYASDTLTSGYANRLRTSLSLAQPSGVWTNGFIYDAARRLETVVSPAGVFNYAYHTSRKLRPETILLPNSGYIGNVYDGSARLTGTYLLNSSDQVLNSHDYTYNTGNQRTQQRFSGVRTKKPTAFGRLNAPCQNSQNEYFFICQMIPKSIWFGSVKLRRLTGLLALMQHPPEAVLFPADVGAPDQSPDWSESTDGVEIQQLPPT